MFRRWAPFAVLFAALMVVLWVLGQGLDRPPGGPTVNGSVLVDAGATYDPTESGEELPDRYRQVLDRDRIAPIYDPVFTTAEAIDWVDDTLVIGVADGNEAKAYSVTFLNRREMVIDEINGSPILVSW